MPDRYEQKAESDFIIFQPPKKFGPAIAARVGQNSPDPGSFPGIFPGPTIFTKAPPDPS